jgi:hypothetical protein
MSQNWTPPPPTGAAGGPGGAPPPNYLIPAILVTLFCCLPGGIVSIIFATQVNSKYAAGDVQGAAEASRKAKMFTMISAGIGLVGIVLWFLLVGLSAITGSR